MMLPVYIAGEGEPLLMIHGIISDGSFFNNTAQFLSDTYKTIAYDRRGYGANDLDAGNDFSVSAQAEDAAEILRKYAKDGAWVLGNSAGGLIAIELCLRFPELVKGLILLEPSLVFDEESKEIIQNWNAELNGYLAEKRTKKALAAFTRVIGRDDAAKPAATLEEMKQVYKNLGNFMHGELNEVQHYYPNFADVKGISVPVKVLVSDQGSDSIFAQTSRSGAQMLGWEMITIHGYHNAIKDHPEESALLIKKILEDMKRGK